MDITLQREKQILFSLLIRFVSWELSPLGSRNGKLNARGLAALVLFCASYR
jgi:hypothetical protein